MPIFKKGRQCQYLCDYNKQTTMIPEEPSVRKSTRQAKKQLLKLEKPIYQLKRSEEGRPQAIIAKLLQKKEKPQIGFLPRSQLFDQLDKFLPVLKQSNQQLLTQEVKPEMHFDAKLEQVEDSSSSDDEEEGERMDEEEPKQQENAIMESVQQFQFNILKYPYLPKQEPSAQTKQDERPNIHSIAAEILASKFGKIVQVGQGEGDNPLEQLE